MRLTPAHPVLAVIHAFAGDWCRSRPEAGLPAGSGGAARGDPHYWQHTLNTTTQNNWYGLSYEKVAMAHIPQILRAIGMDRILTEYYSWRSPSSDPGAQIDLIIDRADGFLNICEVKYSKGDYALTKAEADKIDNRVSTFQQETGTDKNILVTLITVKPVKENAWTDTVSSFVSLQDLLG